MATAHRRIRQAAHNTLQAHGKRRPRKVEVEGAGSAAPTLFNAPLCDLATEVLASRCREMPWELFRLLHLPGWTHDEAAAEVGRWAVHYRIKVDFQSRMVRNVEVIFVCFAT